MLLQKNSIKILHVLIILLIAALGNLYAGKITGHVVDSETGDPIIGANIFLENTSLGAASDLDGRFLIMKVPAGNYTLVVSVVGYTEMRVNNVEVKDASDVVKLDIAVKPEILTTDAVVVEAKALKNTEAALLKSRQKSLAVSDAVSAEAISRAGSGNAAEAMKLMTGASVVDGKYVFVRGLGDRYTSTQLNGAEIPSTDPSKRAGSIDMIPSNLVDNIQAIKSFTPDKPGNFSGGMVDIKTKDFPDALNFSLSVSSSYNSQTTFNDDGPIGYQGGEKDWLGMDDGTRELPDIVKGDDVFIPLISEARTDLDKALFLDRVIKSFEPELEPSQTTPPLNQSYSLSVGNQFMFLGRSLGYLASLSYSRSASSYNDGKYQRWDIGTQGAEKLTNAYDLNDTKTTDNVLWGALLKTSYKLTNNHVISFNGMYNQNGESSARYLSGSYPYDLDPTSTWLGSVLQYEERTLTSYQLDGDHNLPWLFNTRIQWKGSMGKSMQDEPDLRYFNAFRNKKGLYGIKANIAPARYWRNMEEDRNEFSIDFTVPFKQWTGQKGKVKFGGLLAAKDRTRSERQFVHVQEPVFYYKGSQDSLFSEDNVGLTDTLKFGDFRAYEFGLSIREEYFPQGNYKGNEDISAAYLMIDLPLFSRLRFIGGARFESTEMYLETEAKEVDRADFRTDDILPSVNFIYALSDNMNIRTGYNRTLARPMFREIAPYASWDFQGGYTYIGNADLKRTMIDNIDLRWEWFSRPGEIYAVSAFWKAFHEPIEEVFNSFGEVTWMNVDYASVYGMEFELRKKLDIITPYLSDFSVGTNLSLVESTVQIPDTMLSLRRVTRPEASSTRPFQGQSPYLFNFNLNYDNFNHGINASIYYNIFGERLSMVSLGGTPDIYEQPFGLLNFSFSWKFLYGVTFKFSAKNLLDYETKMTHEYRGVEYIQQSYKRGRSFSMGLSYAL